MKVKESPLVLEKFLVEKLKTHFSLGEKIAHNINFDWNLFFKKKDSVDFVLRLKASIRPKKYYNGFSIQVETINIFFINNFKNLEKEIIYNLQMISSISIAIANLRGFLKNLTSYYPMEYILPPIDMKKLFDDKHKQNKKARI